MRASWTDKRAKLLSEIMLANTILRHHMIGDKDVSPDAFAAWAKMNASLELLEADIAREEDEIDRDLEEQAGEQYKFGRCQVCGEVKLVLFGVCDKCDAEQEATPVEYCFGCKSWQPAEDVDVGGSGLCESCLMAEEEGDKVDAAEMRMGDR